LREASSASITPQDRHDRHALNQNLRVQEDAKASGLTNTPAAFMQGGGIQSYVCH